MPSGDELREVVLEDRAISGSRSGAEFAAIRERLDRPAVVVKVWNAPALRDAFLADAHGTVLALALDAPEAERLGLAAGHGMACTSAACARPSGDLAELRRSVRQLSG